MNSTRKTIEYFYKGQKRNADVSMVKPPGEPMLYWITFKKSGPRQFSKIDGVWTVGGRPMDPEVFAVITGAIDEQIINKKGC